MTSRFLLRSPTAPERQVSIPWLRTLPSPVGRILPNGTVIVIEEGYRDWLFKFTPWDRSRLACREIETCALLQADGEDLGTVALLAIGASAEHLVRVMARSWHGTLARYLLDQRGAGLDGGGPASARSLLGQVAATMAKLHARHVIHRDLKAENILVFGDEGEVKGDGGGNGGGKGGGKVEGDGEGGKPDPGAVRVRVADFDRAVSLPADRQLEEPVGSLFHMAPELHAHQAYDGKVDVYAFGILMFEVAHGGARPYDDVATGMPGSITAATFAERVLGGGLRPRWTADDPALAALAARCWAADPASRPTFAEIVEQLGGNEAWPPLPASWCGAARRPEPVTVALSSHVGKVARHSEDAAAVLLAPDQMVAGVFDGLRAQRTSEYAAWRLPLTIAAATRSCVTDAAAMMHEVVLNEAVLDQAVLDQAVLDEVVLDEAALPEPGGHEDARHEQAVRDAFARFDDSLRRLEPAIDCGSTATLAVVTDDALALAWLGDSPAWLFRTGPHGAAVEVLALTHPHVPERPDEAARVAAGGGIVGREQRLLDNGEAAPWGPVRVFVPASGHRNGVALSRALGLLAFRPAIGAEPDWHWQRRQPEDAFLVIGSDGVFDYLDPLEVWKLLAPFEGRVASGAVPSDSSGLAADSGKETAAWSLETATETIIAAVLERGAPDNATIVVLDLRT